MIIALEGIDGSGKTTQYNRICDALRADDVEFTPLSFPRYAEPSSMLVRQYLSGEFGAADSVNAYAAASFFAVDRYATLKTINAVGANSSVNTNRARVVLADRYVGSNAIYQAAKLDTTSEQTSFFRWLDDYEFERLGLPRPDMTLYFDISPKLAIERIRNRGGVLDVHEQDAHYLERCARCAARASEFFGWIMLDASRSENIVFAEVYERILTAITKR